MYLFCKYFFKKYYFKCKCYNLTADSSFFREKYNAKKGLLSKTACSPKVAAMPFPVHFPSVFINKGTGRKQRLFGIRDSKAGGQKVSRFFML